MIKYLLFALALANTYVAAYTFEQFYSGDYQVQMVGFLGGFTGQNLVSNQEQLECMVGKVNKKIFGDNFKVLMNYVEDNKNGFSWNARDVGLRISEMVEGLFYGMRDHDDSSACEYVDFQAEINLLKEQNLKLTELAYGSENKIPSLLDLQCSQTWWQADTKSVIWADYTTFHFAEMQSEEADEEFAIQESSFYFAGEMLRNFYDSVTDVIDNGYSNAYYDQCPAGQKASTQRLLSEDYGTNKHFDCKLCMEKKDVLKVFNGFYDGQTRLNGNLKKNFDVLDCIEDTPKLDQILDGSFEDLEDSLELFEDNHNYKQGAKYFYLIDAVIEEVITSGKCPELKDALSFSTSKHDQIYLPEMVDINKDGVMDEWIFTSNTGQQMDLMPILKLISMHHESYEEQKLAKNDQAKEFQYRIGYLMGMFDSVVDLHGKKKENSWIYWVLGSGAITAIGVALFLIYRRNKRQTSTAAASVSYETVEDTIQPINE